MEKQTAGRNQLGEFVPKVAELNDGWPKAWAAFRLAKEVYGNV